jgi:phosphoribosylglycinamide formyltransferase-1
MRAVIEAIEAKRLDADACLVVSNRADAPALAFATEHGVPTRVIATRTDPQLADAELADALKAANVELVVLSGYLRKLGRQTLAAFPSRILNIHPALLPSFGGEGMYGRRVHEAVAASGTRETGVTVHLVDEEYDHGLTLAQRTIALTGRESAAEVEARVTAAEPAFFVETLQAIAAGMLKLPRARDVTNF